MTTKFHTPDNMVSKSKNTVVTCVKVLISDNLTHKLDILYPIAVSNARKMLCNRKKSSSKFYKDIPCVVAKSLIAKYQRNQRCKKISRVVIPVCGDKGKQVKLAPAGIRIPALFKKEILPVQWLYPIVGFIRGVEIFKRDGKWFCSISYNTSVAKTIRTQGCVGVDRNSVGNVAVMADLQNGKVRKLGFNPAKTKTVFRNRRKNLQKAGKYKLLAKLKRKQSRRTAYENHKVSKSVVDYATLHRRAVVLEQLDNVRAKDSKIRRYTEKSQWAFAQLDSMLKYKCALRGIPLLYVNPAYTSQTCSRCGSIHKPNGKQFHCLTCGRTEHRDANAAFNISRRGLDVLSGGVLSAASLGLIGNPQTEKVGVA